MRPVCYGAMYDHTEDWIAQHCLICKSVVFNKCKVVSIQDVDPVEVNIPEEPAKTREYKTKW